MNYLTDSHLKHLSLGALLTVALILTGCASTQNAVKAPQPKATYQEFPDATWKPETEIRAPYRSSEIQLSTQQILTEGIYAFFDTHRSLFQLQPQTDGSMKAVEIVEVAGQRALTWGTGASTLYRNGQPVENTGDMTATVLEDGRLLLQNTGVAPFNMALHLRAFSIAGKPIRHFLRNANNQPDDLAWFMPETAVFPAGSMAYLGTYWLGDDEIVRPSKNAFTGAKTLENLIRRFSRNTPFCLSYVNHQDAHPYGVLFKEKPSRSRRSKDVATSGEFHLVPVKNASVFCEPIPETQEAHGTWQIVRIQGTRVLELTPTDAVECSDLGIQPVNKDSTDVGFAEVMVKGEKGERLNVVPVKILRNNQPIVDFRLKFNAKAAEAIQKHLEDADRARETHEAMYGAHTQLSRPVEKIETGVVK
ncbi:MAG: hypothetical protein Q4E62_01975 [Sutterellaceae bacterium]|nr:hypothetical protein [Sutterellaceae bacterium]